MTIVSAKRTTCLPSARGSRPTSGPLEMASRSSGTTSVTAKTALKSGSSQQGKALRQSVACIWVVAMTRSRPSSSLKVERYQPRSLSFSVPRNVRVRRPSVPTGRAFASAKLTRSRSVSSVQVNVCAAPSTSRVAPSITSSAELQTSSSVASSTRRVTQAEPVNAAVSRSGSSTRS